MDKTTAKKTQIIQRLTEYVIEHSLADIGLRKLAAVAGTSDRMLIYYFETKDALMGEVLHAIASNLATQLDAVLGQGKRSPDVLLRDLLALSRMPGFYAVIQLWFEIVGLAARGEQPYAQYATVIAKNWLGWIESRLEDDQVAQARSLFAELEGRLLLQIVGIDSSS